MNIATTSPEPNQAEPHPALRLAEAVCALLAAIAGPSWLWRFLPGGRAMWEHLQHLSRDFVALMHRIATAPPAPPIIATPDTAPASRHPRTPKGEVRPRRFMHARQPRSATIAVSGAILPARRPAPMHPPTRHTPVRARIARARFAHVSIALRERRRRNGLVEAWETCALFVSI
ncbi:MAG: hypothetical protein NT133_05605 [Alphaproteobacteria bacterium]|nr:hypothetical protein [Alphaproteobacteria bacterium]